MGHAFHQLFYDLVWATHSRDPHIQRAWRPRLLEILAAEVVGRGGTALRQNAMPDHVPLLIRLPPTIAISDFVGAVKGATSLRVNREIRLRSSSFGKRVMER